MITSIFVHHNDNCILSLVEYPLCMTLLDTMFWCTLMKILLNMPYFLKQCIMHHVFVIHHRYQIALGTTPGGGQIKPFFDIDLEDGVRYYTIGGLNLVGYRVVSL